ncbi:hypothetical protein [Sulfurimonas sp. NWX79]|uniref:hypothetical protein n=1 Tax=Sulfurimonas sp. NWX79 TaxID=2925412 RepID=UPI003204CFEF
MSEIKPYFHNHYDIVSLFREKENVTDFLIFFLDESVEISKKIKESGEKKPYPLIFNSKGFTLSFDYQYYIYILAKWVVKRTGENADFKKVINAFAILQSNSSAKNITKTKSNKKKFLSLFMTEFIGILTNRNKFLDGNPNERKVYIQTYPSWVETLIEHSGNIYAFNQVMIDKVQVEYYIDDYEIRLKNMFEYIHENDIEQVAFGKKNCASYLQKFNLKKEYYFTITDEFLHHDVDLIGKNFNV